jgi:4-amino-4-deoxy-L-arabinose transferase-like glycosyltransferase
MSKRRLQNLLSDGWQRREVHFVIIACLSAVILFSTLHLGDLSGYDDAAYAHEGRGILSSGDWWGLRLNGYLDFDKPPLFVWMVAVSFKLLGISDFAAKFPAALLGFGTILLVYFIARELSDDYWLPVLSMLVMAGTQYFLKYSMHAMTCVPFAFLFSLAVYFYVRALIRPVWFVPAGLAIGLAELTRSPMGLLPLGIVVSHLALTKRTALLKSRFLWCGLLLTILLPSIWFVAEYSRYGEAFVRGHLSNLADHALAAEGAEKSEGWASGLLTYPVLLAKLYWPWLPLMLIGLATQIRKMFKEREVTATLLVCWVAWVIVPFSLAESRVLRYLLPAFPAFSILAALAGSSLASSYLSWYRAWYRAGYLGEYLAGRLRERMMKVTYAVGVVSVLVIVAFPSYRVRAGDMREMARIADSIAAPDQRVMLYSFGEKRWDYRNQLIWYGHRLCRQFERLDDLGSALDEHSVAVIDRRAYAQLREKVVLRGESPNFVCVQGTAHNPAE